MLGKTIIKIASVSVFLALAACTGQVAATSVKPPAATSTQPAPVVAAQASAPSPTAATVASASSPAPKPSGKIRAKEITPTVSIDSVSIPVSVVQSNWNTHFLIDTKSGTMGFMAYVLDDKIYVRASICPPCRGKTYTLDGNKLVCDTCATTFDAATGKGIAGACVNYPKASVAYQISGGNLVMKIDDMAAAYQDTLKAG
jgi:nitrite reductase/ring-hydroxylating ferredoxin subunit